MGSLGCEGFQEVRGVTTGYKGLDEETLYYNRLQGIKRGYKSLLKGYKGLTEVTGAYKRLQGITRGYRGF